MEIPLFIKLRGCINCSTSKEHKRRHGYNYGFDHELEVACVIQECHNYGFSVGRPFFDPEEVIRKAKELIAEHPEARDNAIAYCLEVQRRFGRFYDKLGISLDKLIDELRDH